MATDLSDVLSGTNPPAPEPIAAPAVEPAAPEPSAAPAPAPEPATPPRAEDGKFVKKETDVAATQQPPQPTPPKLDLTDKERALLAAATEERRKRQNIEQRLKELENQKPPENPQQFWDDPQKALEQFNQTIEQKIQGAVLSTRMQTAEMISRSKYQDFDQKIDVFAGMIQSIPGLYQQWVNAPDPAEFAYKAAKNHLDLQEAGNMDAYRAKIEKELRVRLEQEYKAKQLEHEKQVQAIPPTLSEAPGQPGQNKPIWSGPTPLDSILAK